VLYALLRMSIPHDARFWLSQQHLGARIRRLHRLIDWPGQLFGFCSCCSDQRLLSRDNIRNLVGDSQEQKDRKGEKSNEKGSGVGIR
jgi:hypothetical protein